MNAKPIDKRFWQRKDRLSVLANEFGVCKSAICAVRRGHNWKHVGLLP